MKKKPLIIVTGSSGFLGRPLTSRLLKRGYTVIGVDVKKPVEYEHYAGVFKDRFTFVEGSIQDSRVMIRVENAIKGRQCIMVHLAGIPFPEQCTADIMKAFEINCTMVLILEQWAHRAGIKRIIFSSTSLVYGYNIKKPVCEMDPVQPHDFYPMTKAVSERILETMAVKDGIQTTVVRLSNVYGPHCDRCSVLYKILSQALRSKYIRLKNLSSKRNFIYIDDVIEAFFKTITHSQKKLYNVYNIAADSSMTIFELAQKIARKTGIPKTHIICENDREMDVSTVFVSNLKAKNDLHWLPAVTIDNGLKKMLTSI